MFQPDERIEVLINDCQALDDNGSELEPGKIVVVDHESEDGEVVYYCINSHEKHFGALPTNNVRYSLKHANYGHVICRKIAPDYWEAGDRVIILENSGNRLKPGTNVPLAPGDIVEIHRILNSEEASAPVRNVFGDREAFEIYSEDHGVQKLYFCHVLRISDDPHGTCEQVVQNDSHATIRRGSRVRIKSNTANGSAPYNVNDDVEGRLLKPGDVIEIYDFDQVTNSNPGHTRYKYLSKHGDREDHETESVEYNYVYLKDIECVEQEDFSNFKYPLEEEIKEIKKTSLPKMEISGKLEITDMAAYEALVISAKIEAHIDFMSQKKEKEDDDDMSFLDEEFPPFKPGDRVVLNSELEMLISPSVYIVKNVRYDKPKKCWFAGIVVNANYDGTPSLIEAKKLVSYQSF